MPFTFPTEEEFSSLANTIDLGGIFRTLDKLKQLDIPRGLQGAYISHEIRNRFIKSRYSFCMMMYYFNKGIPDSRWIEEDSDGGVKYLPDFDADDRINKSQFTYYAEVLYIDLAGIYDRLSVIPNDLLCLMINKVDVYRLLQCAKFIKDHPGMEQCYRTSYENKDNIQFLKIRNDIIHNESPFMIHGNYAVRKLPNATEIGFGTGSYMASSEVVDRASRHFHFIENLLHSIVTEVLKEQS